MIEESLEIMRWALAMRDPEAWLARDDPALIAMNDDVFKRDLDRYKYPERHGVDPVVHRTGGLAFLREVEGRLANGGQLRGSVRGLADAAIMPFVRQFAAVDRQWFDAMPLPFLKTWLAQHVASDLFSTIMRRAPPWSEGDPPIIVTNYECWPVARKARARMQ